MATTQFPALAGDGYGYSLSSASTRTANFATARAAASGTMTDNSGTSGIYPYLGEAFFPSNEIQLMRGFLPVDTSTLSGAATITAGTVYIYVHAVADSYGVGSVCLVGSTQASGTALTGTDYAAVGSTEFATRKTIASMTAGSWVSFPLNSSGLAAINKGGTTKFAFRTNHDLDNNLTGFSGVGSEYMIAYASEYSDTTKRPYLEVTYTLPGGPPPANPSRRTRGLYAR